AVARRVGWRTVPHRRTAGFGAAICTAWSPTTRFAGPGSPRSVLTSVRGRSALPTASRRVWTGWPTPPPEPTQSPRSNTPSPKEQADECRQRRTPPEDDPPQAGARQQAGRRHAGEGPSHREHRGRQGQDDGRAGDGVPGAGTRDEGRRGAVYQ